MNSEGSLVIEGVTEEGRTFRPTDWIERIAATLAEFGSDHRLRWSSEVFPAIIGGEKCLIVRRGLAGSDPEAYAYVLRFANENRLRVQEDRRERSVPVAGERRAS